MKRNRKTKDYSGFRYGRLTAVSLVERDRRNNDHKWLFMCDCGNSKVIGIKQARSGHTASCGCLAKHRLSERNRTHGLSSLHPKEYRAWKEMRGRCNRESHGDFANYGGRGITHCAAWADFAVFFADMGTKPDGMSLDRINVNGNYEPTNCRWATPVQQANNKRSNRKIVLNGEEKTLGEWCRHFGVYHKTVSYRLKVGYSPIEAFTLGDLRR